jgi:hypothetical protein
MKLKSLIVIIAVTVAACNNDSLIPQVRIDNFVTFNSRSEFFDTGRELAKMTEKQLDEWEAGNSFVSFRTIFNRAQNEWNNLSNPEDTTSVLNKYQDILTSKNGYLIPKIPVRAYQIICNRAGFYKTERVMNRVIGSKIFSTDAKDAHKLTNPEKENEKTVFVSEYVADPANINSNLGARAQATCGYNMSATYFDNQSGCSHDRQVYVTFTQSYYQYTNYFYQEDGSEFYLTYKSAVVEIKLWGSKRNWLCNWNTYYNTLFDLRNTSYTIYAVKNVSFDYYTFSSGETVKVKSHSTMEQYPYVLPDFSSPSETQIVTHTRFIGDEAINEAIDFKLPYSVHIEGKSRGTVGWAIIDCHE